MRTANLRMMSARAVALAAAVAITVAMASVPIPTLAQTAQGTADCAQNPNAMGTARTLEVDTTGGLDIGTMQYRNTLPLGPKELTFTFDDGPNPEHTPKILDALDAHCIKATFFVVGRYAKLHPELVRDAWRRGHTIATHTWSHPILSKTSYSKAVQQIDRGVDAAQAALDGLADANGNPAEVAPFFRFPGLNHTQRLRSYLANKNIGVFSCDIGTDDWRSISPRTLYTRALRMIESKGSGVVIFHDTHHRTSNMLPQILDELARRGYTAVHMVPKGDGRYLAAQNASVELEIAPAPVAQTQPSLRPTVPN